MRKKASFIIAVASAIVLSTAPAVAEEYVQTFEEIDVDGDGYISAKEAEVRTDLSENLQASDTNKDGKLNSAEFSAFESAFEGKGRFTPPEESEIAEPGAAPY
jgi:Ca2+-binding EF-hand superfamily protein